MGRSTTSIRLDDELRTRLAAQAANETTTVTEMIERFVREYDIRIAQPHEVVLPGQFNQPRPRNSCADIAAS